MAPRLVLLAFALLLLPTRLASAQEPSPTPTPVPQASLTVEEDVVPSQSAARFSFVLRGPSGVDLNVEVTGVQEVMGFDLRDGEAFGKHSLPPGLYTLTQLSTAGYELLEVQCRDASDASSVTSVQGSRVRILLAASGSVTCRFINARLPTPTPTSTPTPTPTSTPTLSPSPAATATISPSPTPTPVAIIPPATGDGGLK